MTRIETTGAGQDASLAHVVEAADALFHQPDSTPLYEPSTPLEAKVAVERFAHLFANAPGVFTAALAGAREGAEVLSHDRLQGISVLALATPWLTTKREDVLATGRFGIGLMTLRAISHTLRSTPAHTRSSSVHRC